MIHGLWVDCPPRRVLDAGYLEHVAELGLSSLAVMIDDSGRALKLTWTADQIAELCERCRALDIEVSLVTWPAPDRAIIDAHVAALDELLPLGAAAWEVDVEGLWTRAPGYADAARYLAQQARAMVAEHDCRLDLDTHQAHQESGPLAAIAPHAHRIIIQSYSISPRPDGTAVPWTSRLGPGAMQRAARDRAMGVPGVRDGRVELGIGLAAWAQGWAGHSPADGLDAAYRAALGAMPCEIRWWSSKWAVGGLRREWFEPWLRQRLAARDA